MSHKSAGPGRFRVVVALGDPPTLTNVEHNLGGTAAYKVVTFYRELGLAAHWVKQFSEHKELCANTCRYCARSLSNWRRWEKRKAQAE